MSEVDLRGKIALSASGSRGQAVFDALRQAVRDGLLRPGMPLREEQVAVWFGVSRTPVREAFARLVGRALLEHAGGRGLVIRSLRKSEVYELYAMREVLEGAAAAFAAVHAGEAEIDTLVRLHARFEAARSDDTDGIVRINRGFHQSILEAARNRYLDAAFDDIADGVALLGETTLGDPARHASAIEEHSRILAALQASDPSTAEAEAREHIRAAFQARQIAFG